MKGQGEINSSINSFCHVYMSIVILWSPVFVVRCSAQMWK